mmetsp:Transcript_8583/g.12973  ORF Transcript_8583/g.12973 Transcript_8583/m.12973 type:complete len:144 (+) Transcript_8583:58-489(+)
MMKLFGILSTALLVTQVNGLATPQPTRREVISSGWAAAASMTFLTTIQPANADEGTTLSDDEMAARIARKQALKSGKSAPGLDAIPSTATSIRSDVNPAAAVSLRSRSLKENAKASLDKQQEMNVRDKAQRREDLCEMLGRGC